MPRLLDAHGRPMATTRELAMRERLSDSRAEQPGMMRGRYDAAATSDGNSRHWANADGLAANVENSPEVCRRLRMRSRYEFGNNSYVQGLALTLANHTIGTGPRLQMQTPSVAANQFLEKQFAQWSGAVRLASKLRLLVLSRFIDGAGLALRVTNPRVRHAVKLDLRVRDYDRLGFSDFRGPTETLADGIKFDKYGNAVSYGLLRSHPGGGLSGEFDPGHDEIPAEFVCHWFRSFRPEQDRGRPEITPALPLFAQLRRYTLAVLRAAELAAEIAGVIRTNSSALEPDEVEAMDALEIEMGHLLTLPRGWDISTLKSEQPVTNYPMFKNELLIEAGRSVNAHRGIMLGDHSNYNYASGRLDKQNWHTMLELDRQDCQDVVLDPCLGDFLAEMALVGMLPETPAMKAGVVPPPVPALQAAAGYLEVLGREPAVCAWLRGDGSAAPTLRAVVLAVRDLKAGGYEDAAAGVLSIAHAWGWDGQKHVDRSKEAKGQATELTNGTTTRRRELLAENQDLEQADIDAAEGYGVTVEEYRQALFRTHFPPEKSEGSGASGGGALASGGAADVAGSDDAAEICEAFDDADAATQGAIRERLGI